MNLYNTSSEKDLLNLLNSIESSLNSLPYEYCNSYVDVTSLVSNKEKIEELKIKVDKLKISYYKELVVKMIYFNLLKEKKINFNNKIFEINDSFYFKFEKFTPNGSILYISIGIIKTERTLFKTIKKYNNLLYLTCVTSIKENKLTIDKLAYTNDRYEDDFNFISIYGEDLNNFLEDLIETEKKKINCIDLEEEMNLENKLSFLEGRKREKSSVELDGISKEVVLTNESYIIPRTEY